MKRIHNDGGRAKAGFTGKSGDCVVRAVAIAAQLPYQRVYDDCFELAKRERGFRKSHPRLGIFVQRKWFKDYMKSLGFVWTPTM